MSRPFASSYYPARTSYRQVNTATRSANPYTGATWSTRTPGNTCWELDLDFASASSTDAPAIEAAVLAFGGTAGSELYWWPETLAAPSGTSGNFEVETVVSVTGGMSTIGFKSSSLTAGLLATAQWIVIEGVLYRVISTTTSSGKTATATIFPAYRGRIGGLIDWGMTNYAKAPRWLVTASPELTKDEAGNLLPWTLQLRQIPYATYPF